MEGAIAARPIPSAGIGLVREHGRSACGPGSWGCSSANGRLGKDCDDVVVMVERLLDQVRSGKLDYLLALTEEELEVVQGDLIE